MEFSDDWRSLFPISSVFAAPSLLSGAASNPNGPLLFRPSSPPLPLLSSPSLSLHIPPPLPPSSLLDGIVTFFRCPTNQSFLPSDVLPSLAADVLPDPSPPIPSNNLHILRCSSNNSTLILFFPTGDNAHLIGFVPLSFKDGSPPQAGLDRGDVFKQHEGFRHPYHRILKMSVASASESQPITAGPELLPNSSVEGFLLVTTLYSVNWFRAEMRVLDSGQERPFLVPIAKQGFESSVVDACWSSHFVEESAVLLENGELCWFNLNTKCGGTVKVLLGGSDHSGEWLSCEFGGQPWILIVACSMAVVLVDLRVGTDMTPTFLARINLLDSYGVGSLTEKNDRILAFCKAGYNDFHMAVVSEHRLLLFDSRKPLVPLLTWYHGLDRPNYASMFRLSEIRPLSDEFTWASDSGFAITVGSFWDCKFNLFCYGPRERGAHDDSSLYAWELPSDFPLSGQECRSGNDLVKESFSREHSPEIVGLQKKKDVLAGFCLAPHDLSTHKSEKGGFVLLRLMLSGKLEMQSYCASWDSFSDKSNSGYEGSVQSEDSLVQFTNQESKVSIRYSFIKLQYLYENLNGQLMNALAEHGRGLCCRKVISNSFSRDLMDLNNKMKSSGLSISSFVSEATIPTSIFEIALRRALSGLKTDLVPLTFSKYSNLFGANGRYPVEFIEVPSCLPHHSSPPFFVVKPSSKSGKWTTKVYPGEFLVGPLVPLPILLALQEIDSGDNVRSEQPEEDLLSRQCNAVLKNVFPETSIVDSSNGWDASQEILEEKPFLVYEQKEVNYNNMRSNIAPHAVKEELPKVNRVKEELPEVNPVKEELPEVNPLKRTSWAPDTVSIDKRFATFICGIDEKTSCLDLAKEPVGLEILNLSPMRLDFESTTLAFQENEHKIFKGLKREFAKWQNGHKPYRDLCTSYKIPPSAR